MAWRRARPSTSTESRPPRLVAGAAVVALLAALAVPCRAGAVEAVPAASVPDVASSSASAADSLELELLDVRIDRWLLGVTLEAYRSGSRSWVPLRALATALGLPIQVDRMAGTADGAAWDRTPGFHLDLETGRVRVAAREERLAPGEVRRGASDLLVDVAALARWLPAEFSVDAHAATLDVRCTAPLPIEERRAREQRNKNLARASAPSPFVRVENPYRWLSPPRLDERLRWLAQPGNAAPESFRSETYLAGDLLRAESRLDVVVGALAGEPAIRGSLGRKDVDGGLLGPLRATEVTFGEVTDPGLAAVLAPHAGAGFVVSSEPLDARSPTGLESFVGRLDPGWDAELYRNGTLLSYRPGGSGAEYRFDDIGLESGLNQFEVVLHGPTGERVVERRVIDADPSMPEAGSVRYRCVALDPRVAGGRGHLDLDVGCSREVALVARAAQVDLDDGAHRFAQLGVRAAAGRFETELDAALGRNAGRAVSASASARWGLLAVTLEHLEARHWVSEVLGPIPGATRRRTRLHLSSAFTLPVAGGLPVTIETIPERELGAQTSDRRFGRATVGAGPWSLAWEHHGAAIRDGGGLAVLDQGEDRLALSARSRLGLLRARAADDPHHPETRDLAVGIEREAPLGLRVSAEYERRPLTSEDALHLGLERPTGAFGIGARLDHSSRVGTSAEVTLSLSAAFDPRAALGHARPAQC